jgi:hypothetical protein
VILPSWRNSFWKGLALYVDIVHYMVVIPLLYIGYLFVELWVYWLYVAVVIALQWRFGQCPLVILSLGLREQAINGPIRLGVLRRGIVFALYRLMGRWAILPIIFGVITPALLLMQLLPKGSI